MNAKKKYLFLAAELIMIIVLAFADQVFKRLAVDRLKDAPPFVLIDEVLCLHYLENHGAAFGMLQNKQILFIIIALVFLIAAILILLWVPAMKKYLLLRASIVMIAAGAAGNLIDRFLQGYVVDYIYFEYIDFPIFNFADILVSLGCIMLVLLVLFFYKEEELDFKKAGEVRIHSSMRQADEKKSEAEMAGDKP